MEASEGKQEAAQRLDEALRRLGEGAVLDRAEARSVMETILRGQAADAQIATLLTTLHVRGETVEELTGFAEAMRARARPVFAAGERPAGALVDTCGTGGDAAGTFNVSTAAALVVAGAGVRVAKHGNRSLSSRCGSADVLEALGVELLSEPARIADCIRQVGFGFIFAPYAHTATGHAQKVRRELRFRTVFNLLGPLTNPAGVDAQVVGVFDSRWLVPMAEALGALGVRRAFVVHSRDGLDEASLSEATEVAEWRDARLHRYTLASEDFGLARAPRESLAGGDVAANARIIENLLQGEKGPRRDIVLMNASLALVAASAAADIGEGVERARAAIDSGAARSLLAALANFTSKQADRP